MTTPPNENRQATLGADAPCVGSEQLGFKVGRTARSTWRRSQSVAQNTAQGYSYVTAEDVIAAATKTSLAAGVLTYFKLLDQRSFQAPSGSDIAVVTGRSHRRGG